MRRALALSALTAALAGCGAPPEPPPRAPLLPVPPLAAGLRLTIAPNLPDVTPDDLPETTQRAAEVLSTEGGSLRVRWSGQVRRETAQSAEQRAAWLRARTSAGSGAPPPPPLPPLFEETEVTGTLDFPDFRSGNALLLPGLWPEGRALLKGSTGVWLGDGVLAEITGSRRATLPFVRGRALKEPAAALLDRATDLVRERDPAGAEEWRLLPEPGRSPMTVNGARGEVATLRLASWFGTLEVLPDPKNPLVVAVDPSPTSASGSLSMFAPARVLRMLLAYRVVAIDARPEAAP